GGSGSVGGSRVLWAENLVGGRAPPVRPGRFDIPVRKVLRVELERPDLARERPYRQETFPRALEQPVIAFGALRVVAADIDDVSPGDQSVLCAHARSIRPEGCPPPPLRPPSSRGAGSGGCAGGAGRPSRTGRHSPRPCARARRRATSLAGRASGPGPDCRRMATALRAPARALAGAWRGVHWRGCGYNPGRRSRA